MASLLHCVRHSCRARLVQSASRSVVLRRTLHQTPIALKRKQKASVEYDGDLFGPGNSGESLFPDELPSPKQTPSKATSVVNKPKPVLRTRSHRLTKDERFRKFKELRKFVTDRIGPNPAEKLPPVRNSAWQHLFGLAATPEQLEQVAALFPRWRDTKRTFNKENAELFIRRCEELHCQKLALKVFGDHSKYGFDLPSMAAARRLLHSLHKEYPIQDVMSAVALFGLYKLPPISSDLVSCAMLTSVCFKHGSKESLIVAKELVPHLKDMLQKVKPKTMELPKGHVERAKTEAKEKAWLAWTLTKIEKALKKEGSDYNWLHQWRIGSGHTLVAT